MVGVGADAPEIGFRVIAGREVGHDVSSVFGLPIGWLT
jgi:hypothetical protein